MDINDTIAQLGKNWTNGSMETVERLHRTTAPPKARLSFAELRLSKRSIGSKRKVWRHSKRYSREETRRLSKTTSSSLVGGLRFGARLSHTLHDELGDTTGETKVVGLMHDIVHQLDALDPGRVALYHSSATPMPECEPMPAPI